MIIEVGIYGLSGGNNIGGVIIGIDLLKFITLQLEALERSKEM